MINKKILVIVIVSVVVLLTGFFVWFRLNKNRVSEIVSTEQFTEPSPEVVQIERQKLEKDLEDTQKILDEKQKTDKDLDGLSDEEEKQLGTDPQKIDTDGDGLTDYDEVKIFHTKPLVDDTDGDGFDDGAELSRGYDPLGPGKLKK